MASRNPEENITAQSVKLGSCCWSVPISIHWSFFLLLVIHLIMAFFYGFDMVIYSLIFYGPIHLVTVLCHEIAHALITRKLGGEVGSIVLWPLGGLTTFGPPSVKGEFLTSIAGPLSHLPMMGFWALLYTLENGSSKGLTDYKVYVDTLATLGGMTETLFRRAFWLNLEILVLNVIFPIYPLDGIRILGSFFVVVGCTIQKAAKLTATFGLLLSVAFVIVGIVELFQPGTDETAIIYMLLGALGIVSSNILFSYARTDRLSSHPVFGKDCYKDHFNTPTDTVLPNTERAESPRNNDDSAPNSEAPTDSEIV